MLGRERVIDSFADLGANRSILRGEIKLRNRRVRRSQRWIRSHALIVLQCVAPSGVRADGEWG